MDQRYIKCHYKTTHTDGEYVLYWMQHTQRFADNHALIAAIKAANSLDLPLKVVFNIVNDYPEGTARHYHFMLEGLQSLNEKLYNHGIDFNVTTGAFLDNLKPFIDDAAMLYIDKGYTRYLRQIRQTVIDYAKNQDCTTFEVESEVIVPVESASSKCEYAARTIRPKLLKLKDDFLHLYDTPKLKNKKANKASQLNHAIETLIKPLNIDHTVKKTIYFKGGEDEALKQLDAFIENGLNTYHESNDPSKDLTSKISPYLHFGMISPVRVYLAISDMEERMNTEAVDNYLEQLLIRRELAFNFVTYCEGYDTFDSMTDQWAYETMEIHLGDKRDYLYTEADYLNLKTHDPYFNAAMKEMMVTGYMHNYMRMYWGKKIIEWSPSYEEAYTLMLTLNNRFFLDGRDPNSYAGVAWCFGRHDHGWKDRDVFGKLRYMNANGLKRKFDIDAYVTRINQLKE